MSTEISKVREANEIFISKKNTIPVNLGDNNAFSQFMFEFSETDVVDAPEGDKDRVNPPMDD